MARPAYTSDVPKVYALVSGALLPSFDGSKTLGRLLLPPSINKKYRVFVRRHLVLISVCYFIGLFFRVIGFLYPINTVTHWFVVVSPVLQMPGMVSVSLSLSCDAVRLLFGFFDSWMLLICMVLWTVFLGISYNDIRVALLPVLILDLQNAALSDAYVHSDRLFTASAVIAIVFISVLYVEITLNTQQLENIVVIRLSEGFAVTSFDMVQNTTLTVGMLVFRVAFNKLVVARSRRNTIQTIVYRCNVKLEEIDTTTSQAIDPRVTSSLTLSRSLGVHKNVYQLKHIPLDEQFAATNVVVPLMAQSLDRLSPVKLFVLYSAGFAGFLSMTVASQDIEPTIRSNASIVAFSTTLVFTSTFAAMYQRRLLRRLCRSFDCLFVVFQYTTSLLCIAHLAFWDPTTIATMLCNLLWLLWVLGMDALTPAARYKLGLRLLFAVPVLLWNIGMSVNGMIDVSFFHNVKFQDRVLFQGSVLGYDVAIFTASFLFNRLLLVIIWCTRLTWRFCMHHHGDECIILSGSVEYHGRLRRNAAVPKFGAIAPSSGLSQSLGSD